MKLCPFTWPEREWAEVFQGPDELKIRIALVLIVTGM